MKIGLSMWKQVPDDFIMMSRDNSGKHNSQNAMKMKLGQEVLDQEKIPMSRYQQIFNDIIMPSCDISEE